MFAFVAFQAHYKKKTSAREEETLYMHKVMPTLLRQDICTATVILISHNKVTVSSLTLVIYCITLG